MNHTAYETLAYGKVCEFLLSDWEFRAPLVAIQLGMRLLWTVNLFHFPQCSPLHFLEALPSLSVPVMLSSTCHCSHHRARKVPCAAFGSPSRQPRSHTMATPTNVPAHHGPQLCLGDFKPCLTHFRS